MQRHCRPDLERAHAGQATMIGSDAVVAGMIGDKCYAYSYFLTAKSQCNYQSGQVRASPHSTAVRQDTHGL